MFKFIILSAGIIFFIFNPICHAGKICSQKESQAIEKAINQYLDSNPGLKSKQVIIQAKECVGSYAAAKLHPKKPITDDATVYLQKVDNRWKVLTLGTDFDQEFLKKLPQELRYQNQ